MEYHIKFFICLYSQDTYSDIIVRSRRRKKALKDVYEKGREDIKKEIQALRLQAKKDEKSINKKMVSPGIIFLLLSLPTFYHNIHINNIEICFVKGSA